MPVAQWPRLTLWVAYAVAHGIQQYTAPFIPGGAEIMLKWPNDLYASGRKVAGILAESSPGENGFATAGIGLNVNHTSFPPPLDATATSLRIQTGAPLHRNALAAAILACVDQSLFLVTSRFQEILDWASRVDYLRGRRVSAVAGDALHEGVAQGLNSEGALLIRTTAGAIIRVTSGEVTRFSAIGG
jgi:BirA family biotin operon repressor/biotin-[acetyl-CoA-carboxylase] ligase